MFGRKKKDPWDYGSAVPKPLSDFSTPEAPVSALEQLTQISRMPERGKTALRTIEQLHQQTIAYSQRTEIAPEEQLRGLERLCANDVPHAVSAWLELPPHTLLPDGTDADDAIVEQLLRLEDAARHYAEAALHTGKDSMLIEGLYLDEKYGASRG